MPEPTTEAGKRLLADLDGVYECRPDILVIEAEAVASERQRLLPLIEEAIAEAIAYGIEVEPDYWGNGADKDAYINKPAKSWAKRIVERD